MEKVAMFIVAIMMIVSIPASTQAQVEFKNSFSSKIKVSSVDGLQSITINPGQSLRVPFLQESAGVVTAKIEHWTYKTGSGFSLVDDGIIKFKVDRGKVAFTKPGQEQAVANQNIIVSDNSRSSNVSVPQSSSKWYSSVTFPVKNLCAKTIVGYSEPFLGLCLKADQTSKGTTTLRTGNIQAAFGYDLDPDSIATGKNRKWAVLDKAIPEGMDTLKIYNENLASANSGVKVRKTLVNTTPLGYLITNDDFSFGKKLVKAIPPKTKYGRPSRIKVDFYIGWNVLAIQYKDSQGYPKQAVVLFLVTGTEGELTLGELIGSGESISPEKLRIK